MGRTLQPGSLRQAKLLLRVPNWVGDAVMCLPALRALRGSLPEATMILLARPWVRDIFPVEELNCSVVSYDTGGPQRGIKGRLRIAAELRREQFDAAILFQNAFDAALISWLARIPIRAGYSRQARGPLLTHAVPAPHPGQLPQHESHYYLELLRRLDLIPNYRSVEQILLPNPAGARAAARQELQNKLGALSAKGANAQWLVGLSPGASFGTAKRWPAPSFAELALRLTSELGAGCVFFGSPQESELVKEVISRSGTASVSLAGHTTLAEFMRLVQGCDLFVTNDTGTMHVAAALGVPTLALFGPTNERQTRPLGPRVEVLKGQAFCRPCKLRHCPIDHRCMSSLSVERALEASRSLLLPTDSSSWVQATETPSQQHEPLAWQEHRTP